VRARHLLEGGLRAALLAIVMAAPAAATTADGLPQTDTELMGMVEAAIRERDLATFERLVNWQGASPHKKRVTSYEIRSSFGRPIRSIGLEPFPADGLAGLAERGTLKANMPIARQLRVVFDEPPIEAYGKPPTTVFLLGEAQGAWRIALLVRARPPAD